MRRGRRLLRRVEGRPVRALPRPGRVEPGRPRRARTASACYSYATAPAPGIPHPPFITNPNWDALRAAPDLLRPSDVVIASFPKTGTTLTEQVVLALLAGGDGAKLDPSSQNEWSDARGHGKYQGSKRVIQRRFNVSVPRARVPEKASTLRDRSER